MIHFWILGFPPSSNTAPHHQPMDDRPMAFRNYLRNSGLQSLVLLSCQFKHLSHTQMLHGAGIFTYTKLGHYWVKCRYTFHTWRIFPILIHWKHYWMELWVPINAQAIRCYVTYICIRSENIYRMYHTPTNTYIYTWMYLRREIQYLHCKRIFTHIYIYIHIIWDLCCVLLKDFSMTCWGSALAKHGKARRSTSSSAQTRPWFQRRWTCWFTLIIYGKPWENHRKMVV